MKIIERWFKVSKKMLIHISNSIQVIYANIHAITKKIMNLKKSKDGSTGVKVAGKKWKREM